MASPTPQASLECGSSLPLSVLRVFPVQSSQRPPMGRRVEDDLVRIPWRRILSEASPEKAVASYRSPKRLRRGAGAASIHDRLCRTMASPTPQASLECGSSLPLSVLRVFPVQSSQRPPMGRRVEGDLVRIPWRRILSEASPEKAVASYRSPKRLRRGAGAVQSRPAAPLFLDLPAYWPAFRVTGTTFWNTISHLTSREPSPRYSRSISQRAANS